MRKRLWLSYLAAAVLGAGWHFLYTVLPCPLTAILAPVNESVWEHLKLLYFPPLLVMLFLSFRTGRAQASFWSGALAALLWMPAVLLGVYYALVAGFGVPDSPALDIPLYYASLALGWRLLGQDGREAWLGPMVIAVGILGVMLAVFSFCAPPLPIFVPK